MSERRAERGEVRGRVGGWRAALLCIGALGLVVSVVRGPIGALRAGSSSDFAIFYSATRVWAVRAGSLPLTQDGTSVRTSLTLDVNDWVVVER